MILYARDINPNAKAPINIDTKFQGKYNLALKTK